jgi:membrane associated rhomboid family serine protease
MIPIADDAPARRVPVFNTLFLIANVMIFFVQFFVPELGAALERRFAMVPSLFFTDPITNWYRPFTYMFLHGGWLHLIGNMLFLYIFGDNVEDAVGHLRYILFYLLSGFFGAMLQSFAGMDSSVPLIGASAAISGVITAYMLFFPMRKVLTIFLLGFIPIPVRIPAFLYILVWIGTQVLMIFTGQAGIGRGGVAYLAHLGGILFGFVFTARVKRTMRLRAARRQR